MPCDASAGSSSSLTQRVQRRDERVRALAIAASCSAGVRPARSGAVSPSSIARWRPATRTMKNSSRFDGGDGRELDALEQRRRRIGRFLEHALVEGEPRQLAVDEQRARRLASRLVTPAGRMTSCRPNVCANMSARAVAASCSIVRSPVPSSSSIQVLLAADQAQVADFLRVLGVERIGDAEDRRELVDDQAVRAIERDVRQVAVLRQAAAVVARDVRDDRRLVVGQPEDLRRGEDVLRVLVMGAQADVDADVVQQRRDLEQQPLAIAEPVLVAELVEQPRRQLRDVVAVLAVEPVAVAERLGAGQHLLLEVLGAQPAAGSARSSSSRPAASASDDDHVRAAVSDSSAR